VRLAYTADYTVSSSTEIALEMSTMEDDVIIAVIHNAA
jgi:hypothetical protein